jgi:hypothetical protein
LAWRAAVAEHDGSGDCLVLAALGDMVEYHDGEPLSCFA